MNKVILTAKDQAEYGAQIPGCVEMYFNDEFDFEVDEEKGVHAVDALKAETVPTVIASFLAKLQAAETLDHASVKAMFKAVQKETKLGGKFVFMPVRVALTGNQHGPELAEMIPLLGAERVTKRIQASLKKAGISL